ncbi:MAG: beta-lactamase family protein [Ignavibacteriae bacterium]|nr:class A beta-lactamase-related serine hydrolase [Ignavibacteriota bacterium]NOG98448.1 beta-lactamase family protein [Ignavibacteriota bacterium]
MKNTALFNFKMLSIIFFVFIVSASSCSDISSKYDFAKVDSLFAAAIEDSVFPGAVALVGYKGEKVFEKAYGKFTYSPDAKVMTTDAIFDLASVTKVIGTTSAAMILVDEGKLNLDEKVAAYLPEFGNNGKENVTIRNILLHNTGLPAFKRYYLTMQTGEQLINDIMNCELDNPPGAKYVYSDLGMITLQKVIERITGKGIDKFLSEKLFKPLGMNDSYYAPPDEVIERCVPTELDDYWRHELVKGKVHDENAYMLGGVAGHAGLFSTADDISKVIFTLLNDGKYNGEQIFDPELIKNWTTKQSEQSTRGIGWDTIDLEGYSSAGHKLSKNSFGHTGFTGTSVWADKDEDLFIILLTNRVYPTRKNRKISQFRPVFHSTIYDILKRN